MYTLNWTMEASNDGASMFSEFLEQQPNVMTVPAGATIFREGDRGTAMFGVISGGVDIFTGNVILEVVGPGMVFGEMALVDEDVRVASASARTDCRLVQIDLAAFENLVANNPEFARLLMKVMARRLRRMDLWAMDTRRPARKDGP
ncbi:MAG: Crp/Fnr family transcriptional regulator [bacterium]|jgi:CRP/FNR family cyclic AMP-dependent transcriptional regulator